MVQFCAGKRDQMKYWMMKKESSKLKAVGTCWRLANKACKIISVFRLESFGNMTWEKRNNSESFKGKPFWKEIKKNCFKGRRFSM